MNSSSPLSPSACVQPIPARFILSKHLCYHVPLLLKNLPSLPIAYSVKSKLSCSAFADLQVWSQTIFVIFLSDTLCKSMLWSQWPRLQAWLQLLLMTLSKGRNTAPWSLSFLNPEKGIAILASWEWQELEEMLVRNA